MNHIVNLISRMSELEARVHKLEAVNAVKTTTPPQDSQSD